MPDRNRPRFPDMHENAQTQAMLDEIARLNSLVSSLQASNQDLYADLERVRSALALKKRELDRLQRQDSTAFFAILEEGFQKLQQAHENWIGFLQSCAIDATDPGVLTEFDAWMKAHAPKSTKAVSSEPPPFPRAAPPPRLHRNDLSRPATPAPPEAKKPSGRYSIMDEQEIAKQKPIGFGHLHSSRAPASSVPEDSSRPGPRESVDDGVITIEPPDNPDDPGRITKGFETPPGRTVH